MVQIFASIVDFLFTSVLQQMFYIPYIYLRISIQYESLNVGITTWIEKLIGAKRQINVDFSFLFKYVKTKNVQVFFFVQQVHIS